MKKSFSLLQILKNRFTLKANYPRIEKESKVSEKELGGGGAL